MRLELRKVALAAPAFRTPPFMLNWAKVEEARLETEPTVRVPPKRLMMPWLVVVFVTA